MIDNARIFKKRNALSFFPEKSLENIARSLNINKCHEYFNGDRSFENWETANLECTYEELSKMPDFIRMMKEKDAAGLTPLMVVDRKFDDALKYIQSDRFNISDHVNDAGQDFLYTLASSVILDSDVDVEEEKTYLIRESVRSVVNRNMTTNALFGARNATMFEVIADSGVDINAKFCGLNVFEHYILHSGRISDSMVVKFLENRIGLRHEIEWKGRILNTYKVAEKKIRKYLVNGYSIALSEIHNQCLFSKINASIEENEARNAVVRKKRVL